MWNDLSRKFELLTIGEALGAKVKVMHIHLQSVKHQDCIEGIKELPDRSAQIVICDPPYNIGKDFGNNSDRQEFGAYIEWCKQWVAESIRILKDDGTLYIYGFSEILSHIQVLCLPPELHVRWLIWHYSNKNVASCKFWQRSHESILCVWKKKPVFNVDDVREPYTEQFLKGASGKVRKNTRGRFSRGENETIYNAHEKGALPRDVLKCPALAGGLGKKVRIGDHPTQKPLDLTRRLIKAAQVPDGLVVIPFGGSGTECVVCKELGLPFTAFEINPDYVNLIQARLEGLLEQEQEQQQPSPEAQAMAVE